MYDHNQTKTMRWGHINDLIREAEVEQLARQARAGARRTGLGLAQPAAWVAAELHAAGTLLRRRLISPCGQLTLRRAMPDC